MKNLVKHYAETFTKLREYDMSTPDKRVEEIVRKAVNTMWSWVNDNQAGAKDFEVGYMQEFESVLRNALTQYHQDLMREVVGKQSKRNATIKEYEDEGVMFVLKVENGKTYEASMPIPKWGEVGDTTLREEAQTIIKSKKVV